jgi:putative ABC transport system permease protein
VVAILGRYLGGPSPRAVMSFGKRLRSGIWRDGVDREVDSELEFHLEMRTRALIEKGMDPVTARQAALRRFGDIRRVNTTCRRIGRLRDREMARTQYLSELRQDVVFALRQLVRTPGFTAVAILMLALGIGATTAIFSTVKAVVLNPLPFPSPDRVLVVNEEYRGRPSDVSAGNFVDGVLPVSAFSSVTAVQYSSFNLGSGTDSERVIGARTTAGFFRVFATDAALGRVYDPDEDQPGREQVVVLSHRLWARRFNANPSIVGTQILMNNRPYDVIGVMPPHFDFTDDSEELWTPIAFTSERKAQHDEHYLQVYGRLANGAMPAAALQQLRANANRLRKAYPRENAELAFLVRPMLEQFVGDYARRLYILLGAVAFVLLIACSNIANLLLARGAARSMELAVRTALGAGRGRIVRQLLTESVVLAVLSAAAGVLLAGWSIRALIAAAPDGVPRLEQTRLEPGVLAFALLTAVTSAMLFGLAPAIRAARTDMQSVLKEGSRGPGTRAVRDRLRTILIAGEVAVALLLLVGAGLLIRTSFALQRVDKGFDPNGVLSAALSLPEAEYNSPDLIVATFGRLAEVAGQLPGAEAAAVVSQVPMGGGGASNGLIPEGRPFEMKSSIPSRLRIASPGYFGVMRIALLRGRGLSPNDRRGGQKVMVINEALSQAAFGDGDPIGQRIACCEAGPDGKSPDYKVVVGVVRDVRWRGPAQVPGPEFYLPLDQAPVAAWSWLQRTLYLAVRTSIDPASLTTPLRIAAASVAPGVPLFNVRTMQQRIGESMATAKFNTLLLTLLGGVGLVLAMLGIYGVIAYFVTRRTQEIGVRMALGADRRDVIALVVKQVAVPVGLGIGLGLAASFALMRVLSGQLFGVTAGDPLTYVIVAALLAAVAVMASLAPAVRAANVDPTRALQSN